MNYLERLVDERDQLLKQTERMKKALVDMEQKEEELNELIETIGQLERYKGIEIVKLSDLGKRGK